MEECSPSTCEALGSMSITTKRREEIRETSAVLVRYRFVQYLKLLSKHLGKAPPTDNKPNRSLSKELQMGTSSPGVSKAAKSQCK